MKIGTIELGETPLFLAPMEDVTYKSFRYMCKKYGADVMYTEFVSSEALVREVQKTRRKMQLYDFDRPVAIQIYGHDTDSMVRAARVAEEAEPDFLDINFGCPMKKIACRGAGAGLLQDLDKMQRMAAAIVKAVALPVTAKTRLGWDESSLNVEEAARRLQDAGITALAIHGRTRKQLYTGKADWSLIARIKENPDITIPIVGNGDITGPDKAATMLKQTGVDGLMIGRAAIGRPWIFREIKHYLKTGEIMPPPNVSEIIRNVREQLQMAVEWKDDVRTGILMMRRHFAKYFPGLPDFREYRVRLLQADEIDNLNRIMDEIAERYGHLKVKYTDDLT